MSHALTASSTQPTPRAGGLSIKGKAGPWTVLASNFAPGTTAADIEATLSRDSIDDEGQNGLLSCEVTSSHPNVTVELVFSERSIADRIISTYNNQLADGRYLKLTYQKQQPQQQKPQPTAAPKPTQQPTSMSTAPPNDDLFHEDTEMLPVCDDPPLAQPSSDPQPQFTPRRDRSPPRNDGARRDASRDRDRPRGHHDRDYDRREYERSYERPRYDDRRYDRGPSYRGSGGGRGYGGGVSERYSRAASLSGGGGGGSGRGERGAHQGGHGNYR